MMRVVPMDVAPLIDRSRMPQINKHDIPDLLVFLGDMKIGFSAGTIHPEIVKLHQEVDTEKAMAIPEANLKHPILVSQGWFVLDGDHRAYRHYINKTMVPYIMFASPFEVAYQMLLKFPKTYEAK